MLLLLTAIMQTQNVPIKQEYKFHPEKRWKFDFAIPAWKVAIEVEGGTWLPKGRHTTGKGFQKDCEKYNAAAVMGWRILRYTGSMINNVIGDLQNIIKI